MQMHRMKCAQLEKQLTKHKRTGETGMDREKKRRMATKRMAQRRATAVGCTKHENITHSLRIGPRTLSHYYLSNDTHIQIEKDRERKKADCFGFVAMELCAVAHHTDRRRHLFRIYSHMASPRYHNITAIIPKLCAIVLLHLVFILS